MQQLIDHHLTCAICTKTMLYVVALPCSHVFCRYCIQQWFHESGKRKCPSCRAVHTRASLFQVQEMDRMIELVANVSPEALLHHKARLEAATEEYELLLERVKKEKAEQEAKDNEEANRVSDSDDSDVEDEDFSEHSSSDDEEEEDEEEEDVHEQEAPPRRSSRHAAAMPAVPNRKRKSRRE